jgi:lipoate-protein ligase A
MSSWFLFRSGAADAARNMALDEALLEAMPRIAHPVLRFYSWTQPAASFGYFQKYAEVEQRTALRPLVRRPTGGGLVPHEADWTYSITFPPQDEWYSLPAIESYRRVHEWLQAAFALLGIETGIAPEPHPALPGECFAGHERFDLLWKSQKIAGAAQRRRRDGLLIQGSVQPGGMAGAARREDWQEAMCESAHLRDRIKWVDFTPDAAIEERQQELAQRKYSRAEYNRKR